MDDQVELRRRYRAWSRAVARGERLPFPEECRDLYASGRCHLHGGASTGPKSGPRAKRPEPPAVEPPYDPATNPELLAILRRQGIPVGDLAERARYR